MSETQRPKRYALLDMSQPEPRPVIGWYDRALHPYPNLDLASCIEVTDDAWQARIANPSGWAVSNGKIVPHVRPGLAPKA